jgi:hypothetical protein
MHEREYKRLRKTIEDDYRRKLDALDLIWGIAGSANQDGHEPKTRGRSALLKQAIVDVLPGISGSFNQRDIESKITQLHPGIAATLKRASLSTALKRIAESGKIEVVEKGSGKRATVYKFGK